MLEKLIVLFGMLAGSATDIHHREVPDWINYGMIASGIGLSVISSFLLGSFSPFLESILGFLVLGGIGTLMYYAGQWGGGDAKMMMGVGALIGISLSNWFLKPPFAILFLIITIFSGAAYGLLWMIILMIKHKGRFIPEFMKRLHEKRVIRTRYLIIAFLIIGMAGLLIFRNIIFFGLALISIITYFLFYAIIAVKVVEKTCFIKHVSVDELVEGDWVQGPVMKNKKVVFPQSATGITKKDIINLKKHNIKKVIVKEGIPFVPSFLIAYLITWYIAGKNIGLAFLL